MNRYNFAFFLALLFCALCSCLLANGGGYVLASRVPAGENLLTSIQPRGFGVGFEALPDGSFFLDASQDASKARGVLYSVPMNQTAAVPIRVQVESRNQDVKSASWGNYGIYLDIAYSDGTYDWGKVAPCSVQTENWTEKQLVFFPHKPIKHVSCYFMFRNTPGKAWFRNPVFEELNTEGKNVFSFDSIPVMGSAKQDVFFPENRVAYYLRDVTRDGDFIRLKKIDGVYQGEDFQIHTEKAPESETIRVVNLSGKTRAVTLIKAIRLEQNAVEFFGGVDIHTAINRTPGVSTREYSETSGIRAGQGKLGLWSLAGVRLADNSSLWLGITPDAPAVFRIFYNDSTQELCLAWDLGFLPDKSEWTLGAAEFTLAESQSRWGFRSGWKEYINRFPAAFECRLPRNESGVQKMGNWMAFAKISQVESWEDFGFRFKEGIDETSWDDQHGFLSYRYSEPMTWWMHMSKDAPKTIPAAAEQVQRLAKAGNKTAQIWEGAVMRDAQGQPVGRFLDTPWCNGCVWSMDSAPTLPEHANQYDLMHSKEWIEKNYPAVESGESVSQIGVDGEYTDSSEGYVTEEIDFSEDHIRAASRPATYDLQTKRPVVFRGLISYEYCRAVAQTVHKAGKTVFANGSPGQMPWLVFTIDAGGTETNWNWSGWKPPQHKDLIRKRALCGPKPYCFIQNANFDVFTLDMTEKYFKRAAAYGMFAGFFSPDAASGHYFSRPELYNQSRALFKKYVPSVQTLAQAGWQPEPNARVLSARAVSGAKSDEKSDAPPQLRIERFGAEKSYLTLFNDSAVEGEFRVELENGKTIQRVLIGPEPKIETDAPSVFSVLILPEDIVILELK